MQLDSVFLSEENFRQAFNRGLEKMLEINELGAYILVLANASAEKSTYASLAPKLREAFTGWNELFSRPEMPEKDKAADDIAVFRQIMAVGFEQLSLTQHRMADIWQLQYNLLRSFRPARNATRRFEKILVPFDEGGFHFNKPFLQKELMWQGLLADRQVKLFYNKFPFASLHGLLMLDPHKSRPQWLEQADHVFIWDFLLACGQHLPIGLGYNSLGAYSSVNHQHFQSFVSKKKYPVELSCWQHNGGELAYPLNCRKFMQQDEAWQYIDRLQHDNIAYNLLYRNGEVYAVSRAKQGSYVHSHWTCGFAWSEVMGSITTTTQADYISLDDSLIREEMLRMQQ